MTKQEAIIEMQKGIKVIHRFFMPWEWMTLKDGEYLFDDASVVNPDLFWKDRQDQEWETSWDYFPE